jgi:AcrR family transcriptional regulator
MLPGVLESPVPGRARPMSPDARRAALTAAAVPLLCRYGMRVTTRQIAEAAGVAEGTLFRVFRHKEELVRVAVAHAFDAAPALAELDDVDPALPLRVRVRCVTSVLQRRVQLAVALMIALGTSAPPEEVEECRRAVRSAHASILDRITRLLEPDRDRFRCPVPEVVRLLRLVTVAGSHPMINDGRPLTPEEITDVLLDGVRRQPDTGHRHRPHDDRGDRAC